MTRPGVFFVMTNPVAPEVEDQCNLWYEQQHMPDVLLLPVFTAGSRYRLAAENVQLAPTLVLNAHHRYLTVYELDDIGEVPDARAMLPWLAEVSAAPTDPALDADGALASVYEQISENTTKATLPPGIEAPSAAGVPDGPPAVVIIFSQPKGEADDAEYNRWYDEVHTGETLLLPGYTRSRRFRLAPREDQLLPHRSDSFEHRYLTIYDIDNINCVPLARQAMPWFKQISVQFASPALDTAPPKCWTFEQVFQTFESTVLPDGVQYQPTAG